MAQRDAIIRLILDNKKYQKGVKQSETRSQKFFKVAKAGAIAVVAAFTAMTVGLVAYGKKAFGFYKQQAKAEQRLKSALQATSREYTLNSALIKSYAADLQRSTTIGDELSIAVASIGISMNDLATKDVPLYISAIGNYAVAAARADGTTKDLGATARRVSMWLNDLSGDIASVEKAVRGWTEEETQHVKALVKAGQTREAQLYVLRRLEESYKGMAAGQRDDVGLTDSLRNAINDLHESMGKLLWERVKPYVSSLLDWFEAQENIDMAVRRANKTLDITEATLLGIWKTVQLLYSASGIPLLLETWEYFTALSGRGTAQLAIGLNKVYVGLLKIADLMPGVDLSEKIEEAKRATERWRELLAEYNSPTAMATTVTASPPGEEEPADAEIPVAQKLMASDDKWEEYFNTFKSRQAMLATAEGQHAEKLQKLHASRAAIEEKIANTADKKEKARLQEKLMRNAAATAKEIHDFKASAAERIRSNREANIEMAASNAKLLATSVLGSQKASKIIAGIEAAQALRKLKMDLLTKPGETFAKTMSQMGFWGWASAIAASAAVAVQIKQAFSGIKKYRQGGMIPGNPLRGDSVPVLAQAGEAIIPGDVVKEIREAATRSASNIHITVDDAGLGRFINARLAADQATEVV